MKPVRTALIALLVASTQIAGSASANDHLPPFEIVGSRMASAVVRVTAVVTEPGRQEFFVTCSLAPMDSVISVTAEGGLGRDPGAFEYEPRITFFDPGEPSRSPGEWTRTLIGEQGDMPPLRIAGWNGYSGPWGESTSVGPEDAGTVLHKVYVMFGGVPSQCSAKFNGEPITVDVLVGGYGGIVDLAAQGDERLSRGSAGGSIDANASWSHARLGDGPLITAMSPGDAGSVTLRVPGSGTGHAGYRCTQRCATTFPRATAGQIEAELSFGISRAPKAPFLFFVDLPR